MKPVTRAQNNCIPRLIIHFSTHTNSVFPEEGKTQNKQKPRLDLTQTFQADLSRIQLEYFLLEKLWLCVLLQVGNALGEPLIACLDTTASHMSSMPVLTPTTNSTTAQVLTSLSHKQASQLATSVPHKSLTRFQGKYNMPSCKTNCRKFKWAVMYWNNKNKHGPLSHILCSNRISLWLPSLVPLQQVTCVVSSAKSLPVLQMLAYISVRISAICHQVWTQTAPSVLRLLDS